MSLDVDNDVTPSMFYNLTSQSRGHVHMGTPPLLNSTHEARPIPLLLISKGALKNQRALIMPSLSEET